eukprot:CAMPEP_0177537618 /NCGR_PEP_ID=MMETSP0369-20130122/57880_1 /TAXON_ID=447022 ORGANISM="Scrippsiella hangoei-like, Strain SHHI-4" /NCGR_SAMPLE_ID=MMETSP0369 /ASSEMBLY_ACC=CAM_ASM_000364 /LENGTH=40 /DNA_ID= /DNA_START= /DNA_END= /DNA_ORIENTATION=
MARPARRRVLCGAAWGDTPLHIEDCPVATPHWEVFPGFGD